MATSLIVVLAVLLGLLIVAVEWLRPQPDGQIDFLRATSLIYFVCFVVLPLYLQVDDLQVLRGGGWSWLLKHPFDDQGFVYAVGLALAGYGCILMGYFLAGGFRPISRRESSKARGVARGWRSPELAFAGLSLGLAGVICFAGYTQSIGGLGVLILQAALFRGPNPPVVTPFAFLKTLSPMVLAGAFLLYGVRTRARLEGRAPGYRIAFYGFVLASFLVLFHQAGRFPLAAFLLTFPLAQVIRTGRLRTRVVIGGAVVVFGLLLFGKQLIEATLEGTALTEKWALVGQDVQTPLRLVVVEFAFPVATAANATLEVPWDVPFRWFSDVLLAFAYLVPQRLLGVAHPPTLSMINTDRFATQGGVVPVDLLSFGYFSAGVFGVLLVMGGFGVLLAWFERMLPATRDPVDCILRAAWILFISLRVMYGDPQLLWSGGLHLMIMAALLLSIRILLEERRGDIAGAPVRRARWEAQPDS